jgi:hypothetical protein
MDEGSAVMMGLGVLTGHAHSIYRLSDGERKQFAGLPASEAKQLTGAVTLQDFHRWIASHTPVTCGALGQAELIDFSGRLKRQGNGYTGPLDHPASIHHLVSKTLQLQFKSPSIDKVWDLRDEGHQGPGTLKTERQQDPGLVDYEKMWMWVPGVWGEGKAELEYTGSGVGEMWDPKVNVIFGHAYALVGVTPEGLIQLRNPWGDMHPKPMSIHDFNRVMGMVGVGESPPEDHGGGHKGG